MTNAHRPGPKLTRTSALLAGALVLSGVNAPIVARADGGSGSIIGAVRAPGSLRETMALAAESSALGAARARLDAAGHGVAVARGLFLPRLDAVTSVGVDRPDGVVGDTFVPGERSALVLRQPVYGFGAKPSLDGAKAQADAARERLLLTEEAVLLEAVEAHAGVLSDQRRLELAMADERLAEMALADAKQGFRAGQRSLTEVAMAEARFAGASMARARAVSEVRAAGARYERLTGRPPGDLEPLPEPSGLPPGAASARELAESHAAVRAARREADSARAGVELARAATRPRLSLAGELALPTRSFEAAEPEASFGAALVVPIYRGGAHAAIEREEALGREADHLADGAARAAGERAAASWERWRANVEAALAAKRRANAAAAAVEGVRQEASLGTRSVKDALDAEALLSEAQLAAVEAEERAAVDAYRLLAAVGGLSLEDLALGAAAADGAAP